MLLQIVAGLVQIVIFLCFCSIEFFEQLSFMSVDLFPVIFSYLYTILYL